MPILLLRDSLIAQISLGKLLDPIPIGFVPHFLLLKDEWVLLGNLVQREEHVNGIVISAVTLLKQIEVLLDLLARAPSGCVALIAVRPMAFEYHDEVEEVP